MSTDLNAIRQRNLRAHEEVCGLCDGSREWRMRIPAQPERDSDLVISAALADAETLIDEVARLRAEVARLDADIAAERDMIAAEGYRRGWNEALGMSRAAVAGDATDGTS